LSTYLKWTRADSQWVGSTATVKALFTIERRNRRHVYLRRRSGGVEVCPSVTRAKSHADDLARLANYPPL